MDRSVAWTSARSLSSTCRVISRLVFLHKKDGPGRLTGPVAFRAVIV